MNEHPTLTAAIVTYNGKDQAVTACRSLLAQTKRYPLALYAIDNGSTDGTPEALRQIEGVTVIENGKNLGFGAAHNRMLAECLGTVHFVVNPDIVLTSDALSDLADFLLAHPEVAMVMPKILNPDGTEQKLPKEKPTAKRLFFGRLGRFSKKAAAIRAEYVWQDRPLEPVMEVDFCTGCFFAMRGETFAALGGFDEGYFMYMEDVDLTLRAKRLGRTVMVTTVSVVHAWNRESAKSIKYLAIHVASGLRFLRKWRKNSP